VTPAEEKAFRLFARKCAEDKELVTGFNRLAHASVGVKLPPMLQAVDLATGKTAKDLARFMEFIVDLWRRLPAEARKELEVEAHDVSTEPSTPSDNT